MSRRVDNDVVHHDESRPAKGQNTRLNEIGLNLCGCASDYAHEEYTVTLKDEFIKNHDDSCWKNTNDNTPMSIGARPGSAENYLSSLSMSSLQEQCLKSSKIESGLSFKSSATFLSGILLIKMT